MTPVRVVLAPLNDGPGPSAGLVDVKVDQAVPIQVKQEQVCAWIGPSITWAVWEFRWHPTCVTEPCGAQKDRGDCGAKNGFCGPQDVTFDRGFTLNKDRPGAIASKEVPVRDVSHVVAELHHNGGDVGQGPGDCSAQPPPSPRKEGSNSGVNREAGSQQFSPDSRPSSGDAQLDGESKENRVNDGDTSTSTDERQELSSEAQEALPTGEGKQADPSPPGHQEVRKAWSCSTFTR